MQDQTPLTTGQNKYDKSGLSSNNRKLDHIVSAVVIDKKGDAAKNIHYVLRTGDKSLIKAIDCSINDSGYVRGDRVRARITEENHKSGNNAVDSAYCGEIVDFDRIFATRYGIELPRILDKNEEPALSRVLVVDVFPQWDVPLDGRIHQVRVLYNGYTGFVKSPDIACGKDDLIWADIRKYVRRPDASRPNSYAIGSVIKRFNIIDED